MSVLKNYSYNLLYQITALIVPLVTIPYISRVFGAEGIGIYAVTYAVAIYFCLFGMLGLNTYGTRQIAYVKDDNEECRKTFWNLHYMRLMTMGIATISYFVYCFFIVEEARYIVSLCQCFVLFASVFDISWYFYGKEEFKVTALRNIAVKIIGLVLVFALVHDNGDVWIYTLIMSLTLFGGQAILWRVIWCDFKPVKPDFGRIRTYLVSTTKLWIPAVAINVYTTLDKVMLGYMVNDYQVGLYENSQHMIKFVSTITTTLATVMTPRMANLFAKNDLCQLRNGVYKSFRAVSFLAFPMVFGIMAVRNTFVPWFFGDGFSEVSTLLFMSSFLVLTLSWSNVMGNQVLIACAKEKYYTIAVTTGAAVNLLMNIVLIPSLYCKGAILSSLTAEYVGMFMMVYFSRDIIPIKHLFKGFLSYLIASLLMYFVVFNIGKLLGNNMLSTVVQLVVASIVYLGALTFMRESFLLNTILPKIKSKF